MDEASMETPTHLKSTLQAAQWLTTQYPKLTFAKALEVLYVYVDGDFAARPTCPESVSTVWCATARALRDIQVTCPSIEQARIISALSEKDESIHMYELAKSPFTPMMEQYGKGYLGVTHFAEVPYIYNELQSSYGIEDATEQQLAEDMSGAWAAFAASGSPATSDEWLTAFSKADVRKHKPGPFPVQLKVFGGSDSGARSMAFKERRRCEFVNDVFGGLDRYQ
jgi:carboxylesterase type B